MSSKGYVDSVLNQLPAEDRKALQPAFHHVMDEGAIGSATKATNFRWVRVSSTTAAVANTEFSIAHGLGVKPTWLIPAVDLTQVNSQLVTLTVTRAPDAHRVYLSSPSTSVVFTALLEY